MSEQTNAVKVDFASIIHLVYVYNSHLFSITVSININPISNISDFEEEFHSLNIDIYNGPPIYINNFIIVHYNINSI